MTSKEESASRLQLSEPLITFQATLLAREGNFKQAEDLLLPFASTSQSLIGTLDLLAKVYAQQGKIEEARELWLVAAQKEPSDKHFLRAVSHCENIQRLGWKQFLLGRFIGFKTLMAIQKAASSISRFLRQISLAILGLLREIYIGSREVGLSFMEAWKVLIGKESWYL